MPVLPKSCTLYSVIRLLTLVTDPMVSAVETSLHHIDLDAGHGASSADAVMNFIGQSSI